MGESKLNMELPSLAPDGLASINDWPRQWPGSPRRRSIEYGETEYTAVGLGKVCLVQGLIDVFYLF